MTITIVNDTLMSSSNLSVDDTLMSSNNLCGSNYTKSTEMEDNAKDDCIEINNVTILKEFITQLEERLKDLQEQLKFLRNDSVNKLTTCWR